MVTLIALRSVSNSPRLAHAPRSVAYLAAILAASGRPPTPRVPCPLLQVERLHSGLDDLLKKGDRSGRGEALASTHVRTIKRQKIFSSHDLGDPIGLGTRTSLCALNNGRAAMRRAVVYVSDPSPRDRQGPRSASTRNRVMGSQRRHKWIGVPWCVLGAMIVYRNSWFDEVGVSKFPEDLGAVPRVRPRSSRPRGHPIGQTLALPFGDAPPSPILILVLGGKDV